MNQKTVTMPTGIPYIIGNEAAERFSYYGMRTILVVFMTQYLMNSQGEMATMSEAQAKVWYHTFMSSVYFFPIIGALLADIFWGKYKTIMTLSVVYCLGHLSLAFMDVHAMTQIMEPRTWLALGLGLIAVGSGGIKPCVTAHVGDQFKNENKSLIDKVFSWFYFSINFGAFLSTIATPWLLESVGPAVAFGVPGLLMMLATWVFWLGRNKFTSIPAAGWQTYKSEIFSAKGLKALVGLGGLYCFVAIFWSLYDQTGSSWVLQAQHLDRNLNLGFTTLEVLPSQVQAVNPIFVMMFIPIFSYIIYPFIGKFTKVTALRKMGAGFFITGLAFAITAVVESWIQAGHTPSMWWQILAFVVITCGEVLISITALEFSYTQAPNSMKSFIMGIFLLSVSIGNIFTSAVNSIIQNADGTSALEGASYYWFFVGVIAVTGLLYIFAAKAYKEETYLQA